MSNPIQKAQELRDLLSKVLIEIRLAATPRRTLEEVLEKVEQIIIDLRNVNENVVPLDLDEGLSDGLQFWKQLPTGRTLAGDPLLDALVRESETLDALQRSGVEITSVNKFTDAEMNLAKEIGDNFQSRHWALQKFKAAVQHKNYVANAQIADLKDCRAFFNSMKQHKVIATYKVEVSIENTGEWQELNPSETNKFRHYAPIRLPFELVDDQFVGLIGGDWFNAYAFQIISRHLVNNRFDFELFTRVQYQAPRDIIRSDGDFDIIGKIKNRLLFVECKSGKLPGRNSPEVRKIIENTEDLKAVFNAVKTGIDKFTFLTIYNPFLPENENIPEKLSDDIWAVKPFEIRGKITEIFRQGE